MTDPAHAARPRRDSLVLDTRLDYPGYFENPSFCRLRLYQLRGYSVAIITEAHDNPGTSITNCIETVCHRIVREYEVDPVHTFFIEHYPGRLHPKLGVRDETFDVVTFGERLWNHFAEPRWRRLETYHIRNLIGQPWVPEHYPTPGDRR